MKTGAGPPFFDFSPGVPRENEKMANFAKEFVRGIFKNFRKFYKKRGGVRGFDVNLVILSIFKHF